MTPVRHIAEQIPLKVSHLGGVRIMAYLLDIV